MIILQISALFLLLLFFLLLAFSIYGISIHQEEKAYEGQNLPKVSLLLAARNEEKLILRSLESIANLEYPSEKLEVLIGNDQSTDQTESLIRKFIQEKENYKMFNIQNNLGKGRGKANVLAHLAHQSSGDFFLITDVDVQLPKFWIKGMISAFEPEIGIVSGTTMCAVDPSLNNSFKIGYLSKWFSKMQAMDWLHFMGYIKAFANMGVSCTSVGNNMAVRAKAYWQTGGYEQIEFSITEDYKLFEAVTNLGWSWKNLGNAQTLGKAYYIPNVKEMLEQRKRWLIGAKDLPWNWKCMLVLYGLFYPLVFTLLFIEIHWALFFLGLKFFAQMVFITQLVQKVEERQWSALDFLTYEIYLFLNTMATSIYYFLPKKSVWKGRPYSKKNILD